MLKYQFGVIYGKELRKGDYATSEKLKYEERKIVG